MSTDENLNDWLQKFDILNYPVQVYQELVVEGKEHSDKLSIMGAWKTGSLRESTDGTAYIDKLGKRYKFTNRWKPEAPVGYDNWQYISANQDLIKSQVPSQYEDAELAIVTELRSRPGFGFIWTLFVLHCFDPKLYPLYDQHVYRAFIYLREKGIANTDLAPNNWSEYSKYRQFFLEKLSSEELSYWELDRALWALGKSIKLKRGSKSRRQSDKLQQVSAQGEGWSWDFTLGDENQFWWKLDAQKSLHIMRQFKNSKYKSVLGNYVWLYVSIRCSII